MIFPESVSAENENEAKEQTAGTYGKNVIAIGRQFGSGGHDIGKILAEKLGYDFYDAEIIQMTKLRFRKMKNSVQITTVITPAVCGVQPETLISA